jgi:hypothetical protein
VPKAILSAEKTKRIMIDSRKKKLDNVRKSSGEANAAAPKAERKKKIIAVQS